ncbi:AAA family ATPase [Eisenbergiella tayi]|jgi:DNA transposition AAA+ family ATPase|nr:AAA family ATPase [Eisenbergiella tayi]
MKNLQVAHTQTLDEITMAVSFAEAAGDISLIYGDAGLGKTVSLKEYTKSHPDTIYVELKDCDKSTKGVCEKILSSIGKEQHGVDRLLVDAIIDFLTASPRLVIIDEAQHLSIRALENLRAINDTTETGIVLCGNPTVYDRMHGRGQAHFAQLYSRIGIRRHIVEPTLEDITTIFAPYSLGTESLLYLHQLALQRGGIRNCVKVLNIALQLRDGIEEPLTIDHLQSACQLRNGAQ